jgi:aldehyde dehydrogenase (NAD+)
MTSVQLETPNTGKYEQPTGLFINNEFVKGVDGKTFEVINPSNEKVICSVHEASEKDVDIAVAAARKAFEGDWRKVTPCDRGKLLVKLADLFDRESDQLAAIESLDNGKAFTMAKGDVAAASGCLRYYGGWADKIEGKVVDTSPDTFNYIRKEPVSFVDHAIHSQKLMIYSDWCLWSDHPLELPSSHVGMEDRSRYCLW